MARTTLLGSAKPPPLGRKVRLDHVQLAIPAGTENEADTFYVGLLGLTSIPKPAALAGRGGRWYELGELQLHLGAETAFSPSAKAHVALRTTEFDALRSRLMNSGARVVDDDALEDVERFYTYDPAGNRLEIIRG
jgi:catechol 2,3-dioxygenase-like lactoylglutathione lyase family enzyme